MNGVSLSIYSNPFDPNNDFNAVETTQTYGDPTTGLAGGWAVQQNLGNTVNRVDGRSFYAGYESGWLLGSSTNGAPAYIQLQAPAPFAAGTLITAHSVDFSGYTTPEPYTLKLSLGNPGQTTAAWAAVPTTASGPGVVDTHRISSTLLDGANKSTVRLEYSSSAIAGAGPRSDVSMNEVLVLPDRLLPIPAVVTAQSAGGTNMQAPVDGDGGGSDGFWYDQLSNPATSKFFQLQLNGGTPATLDAMVIFPDDLYQGQALQIRKDGPAGLVIAQITATGADILPIHFLTPVTTSVLRFEWLTHSPAGAGNVASIREVLLFSQVPVPEPNTFALLSLGAIGMGIKFRRRGRK